MFYSIKEFLRYRLRGSSGEIGKTGDFLFGVADWVIRYAVADTGNWLSERKILIPRKLLSAPNLEERVFTIPLSHAEIEACPPLPADEEVTRHHEAALARHLSLNPYAYGDSMVGGFPLDRSSGHSALGDWPAEPSDGVAPEHDVHLRSCAELHNYDVHSRDGDVGRIIDLMITEHWKIRYLVAASGLWHGRKFLIGAAWVKMIDWARAEVRVDFSRAAIEASPAYDPEQPIDRDYEERLHAHYQQPVYW